jgi:ATP-dependent DNA helicase DinG
VGPFALVDLETTGLAEDPASEPIEVGAVLVEPGGGAVTTLWSLVRASRPLPRAIRRLTGLADADLAGAPAMSELAPALALALGGRALLAHNAAFERAFLARSVDPALAAARYLDTQDLFAVTHPDAPDLRLETFVRAELGREERHRALEDALDAGRLLSRAGRGARAGEARYVHAAQALGSYAPDSPWLAILDKPEAGAAAERPAHLSIGPSEEPPVPFDEEAIAAVLADAERGRRHFPGYRVREAQILLARHFVRTLRDGGVALLEGGTGVGKSLAYLAAAIPFAMERAARGESGPVVVSTRTRLLQDQLLCHDIAAAARFLGWPGLRAMSIKGRGNYTCARRLAAVLEEGLEPRIFAEDRLAFAVLAACARTRPWGEVGSVPAALLRRFPALRELLRRSVAERAEQCSREQCAGHPDCALGRRRAALADAHLVVANHDLLLRWPPDYPDFTHAVVDEAHELAGVADEVFALEVGPEALVERFDDVFGRPDEAASGRRARGLARGRSGVREARAWRRSVQQELVALGRVLAELAGPFGEVQVPEVPGPELAATAAQVERATTTLAGVSDTLERLPPSGAEEATRAVARLVEELRGAASALRAALGGAGSDAVASFVGLEAPYDRWRLLLRPVSPAEAFHERFLQRLRSFAGVSASLFVAGDAFAALGELELEARAGERLLRVSAPSPFPYADHMRVVALREGGDLVRETCEVIAELALRLGGRTLGLFTSLRRMNDVAELLDARLRAEGLEVLAPRRASDDPSALVERFRRGGAVLLGARTFWQGVDIPGSDLQAVVIEKLPFEVPTELRRRRELRLRRAGVDAFSRYTVGKMLLHLKQMVGRLIRTEDDRGLVVIVEGRTDRPYFARLAAALPPGARVTAAARRDLPDLLTEVGIATKPAPVV